MIIPFRGSTIPASAALLGEAIEAGLDSLGLKARAVTVEAPAWPEVSELKLDLSGARVTDPQQLPRISGAGGPTLAVERLAIDGHPLIVHDLPTSIELRARTATLQLVPLTGGQHALVLQNAADGTLGLSAERAEIERLAHTILSGLARQHGADIVQTRLQFTSRGPRSLSVQGEVTAKMMMMKVPITVAGDVDVSDDLQLRISNLRLTGTGMAAGLARGFLQPHFEKVQQKPIDLGALAVGQLRLRQVGLAVDGETLRLNASFGS